MLQYFSLSFTIVATVAGQILMKKGMMVAGTLPSGIKSAIFFMIKAIFLNPYIFFGLVLAVLSTVSWMITLSRMQLSLAYPFVSLGFPLVVILSSLLLGERSSPLQYIGVVVILIGLVIISKG